MQFVIALVQDDDDQVPTTAAVIKVLAGMKSDIYFQLSSFSSLARSGHESKPGVESCVIEAQALMASFLRVRRQWEVEEAGQRVAASKRKRAAQDDDSDMDSFDDNQGDYGSDDNDDDDDDDL